MNERIKAIWNKAASSHEQMETSWQTQQNFLNRFAELIVRECMSVADLPKNPSRQWDHLESSEVIAKHFGIE